MANHTEYQTASTHETSHGSLKSYSIGFLFSILLTIVPVVIVWNGWFEGTASNLVLMAAAVLQFAVQLVYFMHLREEGKPRYNLMALILGLIIVLTIVIGSIWIMTYNMVAT